MWSSLLASPELGNYVKANQRALGEAYSHVTSWLKRRSIPYVPAHAGHFVLIDLRAFCSREVGPTREGEVELARRLLDAGVYLGPGALPQPLLACH